MQFLRNPLRSGEPSSQAASAAILASQASEEIVSWPEYKPTRLFLLPGLARETGVRAVLYKDESGRLGQKSFKALGGTYAILRALQERLSTAVGRFPSSAELRSGKFRSLTAGLTVTCATDGNHGLAVAWGARLFGCNAAIYVHAGVSDARRRAIMEVGAQVRVVSGNYDHALARCESDAASERMVLISDTGKDADDKMARVIMSAYQLIGEEALEQAPLSPTHVFVQCGVGGLAAAICCCLRARRMAVAPLICVVEPTTACPAYLSAVAGMQVRDTGTLETIMAGLACGTLSTPAWDVLRTQADGFLTIEDSWIPVAMRLLSRSVFGDACITAGESGAAGLAGYLAMRSSNTDFSLDQSSVVLVIGTEGATDVDLHLKYVSALDDQTLRSKIRCV